MPWISRPVATLVAIMQNASCGVRTLMACQLRFSTSTIALVNMFINSVLGGVCSLLVLARILNWLPRLESHQGLQFPRPARC